MSYENSQMRIQEKLESLTVVIPTWNSAQLTLECMKRLIRDGVPESRIVVVDNGSTDDCFEQISTTYTNSRVIHLTENVGFARAVNVGTRALPGELYLIINDDAFVHSPRSVGQLVSVLDEPSVGLVVPRLLNEDLTLQPNVVPTYTPSVAFVRASGLSRLLPNRLQPSWSTHWDHSESREIQAASGAVMLVRGELWDQTGGFDEEMRMYTEDLDLCWRAHRLGWKVRFEATAEFIHLGNSSGSTTERRALAIARSERAMLKRNMNRLDANLTLGLLSAGVLVRWVYCAATRDVGARATYSAWLRGYLGLSGPQSGS